MPSPHPARHPARHREPCRAETRGPHPPSRRRHDRSVTVPPPAAPGRPLLLGRRPRLPPPPSPLPDPQAATPLLDAVLARGAAAEAAWHIPGHKRGGRAEGRRAGGEAGPLARLLALAGPAALAHDLTELAGLDVLAGAAAASTPTGPIGAAQALAAAAVGAGAARFCVNGATGGLAAAVSAAAAAWRAGERVAGRDPSRRRPLILAARNCHASVFAAAAGADAEVGWVTPPPPEAGAGGGWPGVSGPLTPATLAAALAAAAGAGHPPPAAVVLVSPTYFGAVADVAALAAVAAPAPLIVDGAHGPHFGAHPSFPPPPTSVGATLSVASAHKALASLGQAALVHVAAAAPPDLVSALDTALAAQQTSSPSYLLLASVDAGRAAAFEARGAGWGPALAACERVRATLRAAPGIRLLCDGDGGRAGGGWDALRVTFAVDALPSGRSGAPRTCCGLGVAAALEAGGGVVVEAALPGGAVVLAGGAGTGPAAAAAVAAALPGLLTARDGGALPLAPLPAPPPPPPPAFLPPAAISPRDALYGGLAWEAVALGEAAGRVCAEALTPYPPGVPAVLPGEVISPSALATLAAVLAAGGRVAGAADASLGTVRVFVGV